MRTMMMMMMMTIILMMMVVVMLVSRLARDIRTVTQTSLLLFHLLVLQSFCLTNHVNYCSVRFERGVVKTPKGKKKKKELIDRAQKTKIT